MELLRELAVPRLVGTPGHDRVRVRLKEELAARGFVNLEHEFPVRPPGTLAGPALTGGLLAWVSLVLGAWRGLGLTGTGLSAAAGLAAVGLAIALRVHRPQAVQRGINVVAVRPRARVSVWLAAHYDSKGQPVSMLVRLCGAGLATAGAVLLVILGVSPPAVPWAVSLAIPGLLGGLVLLQNRATNASPGAVDNASALVAVLATLDRLPAGAPIGVLWLDAEEYGLLGARALVRERPNLIRGATVLNLDGIDDSPPTRCVVHRAGPHTAQVVEALAARSGRVFPVFVDGLALAPLASECVTIMRGNWRTAAVVHTRADRAERMSLEGCAAIADGLARALGLFLRVDAASGGP
jgi:hypothetical protein